MPVGVYVRTKEQCIILRERGKKCACNPEWRRKNKEANQKRAQDPEWRRKTKEAGKKRANNPEWRRKIKEAAKKRAQDPEWRRKTKEAGKKRSQNLEWQRKMREGGEYRSHNPEWRRKNKEANQKRAQDPEWIRKNRESNQQKYRDPEFIFKVVEGIYGGFWYGNINYHDRKQYCELWNPDLWNRIDVFQNFKSILSDKTKEDNGGYALSRHHVYWQEKACCIWDEDAQGYYAMINIGSRVNPQMYKYYVNGDPNKFVLLTRSEHAMIAKDKIKWIKIFEELIKTKFNDKCYYTKEEYSILQSKIGGIV